MFQLNTKRELVFTLKIEIENFNDHKMENLIILLLCFISFSTFGQSPKVEFNGNKWNAPYNLNIPEGWDVERFLIPIEFAPQIPYEGIEDIRFTPGWGNVNSKEY